jgi:hypothetical protein
VIHRIDEQLAREAARFRLVFTCERCAQFEPAEGLCSLGYPSAPHRARPLVVGAELIFCKTFELAP